MIQQKSMSGSAWVQLIMLAMIWGASFMGARIALNEIGPFTLVLHRVAWAMGLLWIVVLASGQRVPRDPWLWLSFLIMGVLNNVLPFLFLAWGQLHIETGLTAIFNSCTAVFGVVVASLLFADERLTARKGAGVLLGLLGVIIAMGFGALTHIDLRSLAQLSVLSATLCYALAGSFARSKLTHLKPMVAATGMLTCSTLVMLPLAWTMEGPPSLALAPRTWLALGYCSLMATGVAYLLYYSILAKAGSGNAMLVTLLLVPVAITLGYVVLGEDLLPRHLIGFVVLALGLVVLDGRVLRRMWGRRIGV